MKVALSLMALMTVLVVGGIMIGGCETTQSSSNEMTFTPASATLTPLSNNVTFIVSGGTNSALVLPLKWSVTDPSLGKIVSSADLTATYLATGVAGANTVIVRDQALAEGFIPILFPSLPLTLTATATPSTLSTNAQESLLSVSGGVPPYTWIVADSTRGSIVGSAVGATAVYQRSNPGDNAVAVTDDAGDSANVVIAQPF